MLPNLSAAHTLAGRHLADLPDVWAHTRAVARHAEEIAPVVGPIDRDLLICAAWLHDIGHDPSLRRTGWYPLDGALHLVEQGWPERLAALVAHHSESGAMARALGLEQHLEAFPREDGVLLDALTYCDLTTSPSGGRTTLQRRLDDLAMRHADDNAALVAARTDRRRPLREAVERTESRLQGIGRHGNAVWLTKM
jgi:putative nucleotidyltransferase with HDIG domain